MAHMFFPVSQQDAAGTSPALPAAFVLAGDPAAPKTALLLSYAYSGALRGACFPFPQGCQAGRGCCARERIRWCACAHCRTYEADVHRAPLAHYLPRWPDVRHPASR